MTNTEFKAALTKAFKTHMFMQDRDYHTVNELLYILEHDVAFKDMDFNISVCTLALECWCIPCLDTFVTIDIRSVWFADDAVKFEVEEFGEERFNCITVHEIKED